MDKVDFKMELKALYQPSARAVVEVDVPAMNFLMIDGSGDPNTAPAYAEAVAALFSVSYAAKFLVKKEARPIDYTVMPLEGLWWADDMAAFSVSNKANWKWTMMIMQPDMASRATIRAAVAQVTAKKPDLGAVSRLRFETFPEGRCAQILHIGPFSTEGPTIEKVHQFIATRGQLSGRHHEIYLSDIRRANPSKWRTIIRQPLR